MTQEDNTEGAVATMLHLFNFTCKTHTSVMALKTHIQQHLFSEDVKSPPENESDVFFGKVVFILSSLETAAATLQEIQARKHCT